LITASFAPFKDNLAILPGNLLLAPELRAIRVAQTTAMLSQGECIMLWTVFVVLLILWFLGFHFAIGGGLIHILLVIALIVLVYNLFTGRRGV